MTDEEKQAAEAKQAALDETRLEPARAQYGRLGLVRFEGHTFAFQQPNEEHGNFWMRGQQNPAANWNLIEQLAAQLIVAVDDTVSTSLTDREPVRLAFRAFLKTRPLACRNEHFEPVLSELLGFAEQGASAAKGKGCRVLSAPPAPSQEG